MKTSTKFKIFGFTLMGIAIFLIISSFTVFKLENFPNPACLIPGAFLVVISIMILVVGFMPQINKTFAKLDSETMDYAGKDIAEALDKSVDVVSPSIEKTVKAVKKGFSSDIKNKLDEAKVLYDNGDISEEEYEAMRKNILNI